MGIFSRDDGDGFCNACYAREREEKSLPNYLNPKKLKEIVDYLQKEISSTEEIGRMPLDKLNTWELARSYGNLEAWKRLLVMLEGYPK